MKWQKVSQEGLGSWWVLGDTKIEVWQDMVHGNGAWCPATGIRGFEIRDGQREVHSVRFLKGEKSYQRTLGAAQKWAREYAKGE